MASRKAVTTAAVLFGVALIGACGKKDEPPPQSPQPYATGQYPPGQQPPPGQYPPGQYPPPAQTGAYPSAPPPGTAPPAGGTMATPGPLALPCQNDQACGFAKCNLQFQKCAFPCANSAIDCAPGHGCNTMTGFCLPGQQ